MKTKILILLIFYNLTCYSKTFNSIKDGNFDDPKIWLEKEVPKFKGDTINISHAIYFKRKNDTIKSFATWYDLNRINILKEGVLCMRNENYVIYSVYFNVQGQLYVNKTTFWFTGFDITGYVSCDDKVSWREVQGPSIIHGYGFNIGIYVVEDNCSIISNETQGFDTNCRKTAFVLVDSPISYLTSKYIVFSNLKINTKLIFPDTTIFTNSDEGVIYTRKSKDSLKVQILATDSCSNNYSRKYTFSPIKTNSISNTFNKDNFEITYTYKTISINSQDKNNYQAIIFDVSAKIISNTKFKDHIDINLSDNSSGVYLINIFDEKGKFQMSKKIAIN